jgi:hypothetical protein
VVGTQPTEQLRCSAAIFTLGTRDSSRPRHLNPGTAAPTSWELAPNDHGCIHSGDIELTGLQHRQQSKVVDTGTTILEL